MSRSSLQPNKPGRKQGNLDTGKYINYDITTLILQLMKARHCIQKRALQPLKIINDLESKCFLLI